MLRESKREKRTVVIRVGPEEMAEDLRVGGGVAGPHIPYLVAHRVRHEFILGSLHDIVGAHIGRLRVWIF